MNAGTPLDFLLIGAVRVDRHARPIQPLRLGAASRGTVEEVVAGAVFHAAIALRACGARVTLIGPRGGDPEGQRAAAALAAAGIIDRPLTWLDRRTPSCTAILDGTGELVAGIADMELCNLLTPRALSRRHFREEVRTAGAFILDANLPQATIEALLALAGDRPAMVLGASLDNAARIAGVLHRLAMISLTRAEAAAVVGGDPSSTGEVLAGEFLQRGVRRAVITDGPGAVILLEGERIIRQAPPAQSSARRQAGTCEALAALTLLALQEGRSFADAVRFGLAGASLPMPLDKAGRSTFRSRAEKIARELDQPREVDLGRL